jgi:Immunity protein Imm6
MANDALLDDPALLEAVTIRARSAYFIAVAENVFAAVPAADPGLRYAHEALTMAWQWIAGAQIAAEDLYLRLENEDGTDLMAFGYKAKDQPVSNAAWSTLITAYIYLIWQAYRAQGAVYLPQTIESADDTMVADLHQFAGRTGKFNHEFACRIRDYLLANYPASKGDDLGPAISRGEVMGAKD